MHDMGHYVLTKGCQCMYQLEKAQVCLLSKIIHTACSQFVWQCSILVWKLVI